MSQGIVHPSLQPQTRFVIAATAIVVNRSLGRVNAFDDGLKQAGYTNLPDFWEDLLSEPRPREDFIHYMASFHFSFSPFSEDDGGSVVFDPTWMNHADLIKITLRGLLAQATQTEEPFVLKAGLIEPHGAVRWLLSKPLRRSLIPAELIEHIEGIAPPPSPPKRKGGRPPAADWSAIEVAVNEEIDAVGLPSADGVPGWRTITDVIKWVEERTGQDTPGKTALKENVGAMIRRATVRKAGN
jgi:hypothetical protein